MNTFLEQLKSGKPFIHKSKFGSEARIFGILDDEIPNVYHVYSDNWITKGKHSTKFEHNGIVIGNIIYDAGYTLQRDAEDEEFGLKCSSLEYERNKLQHIIKQSVAESISEKAMSLATEALQLAKSDLHRVKEEEHSKGNNYNYLDYKKHNPKVSKELLQHLIYRLDRSFHSFGKAYQAFFNGKFDSSLNIYNITKADVTKQDTLRYLASGLQPEILNELIHLNIDMAEEEITGENNHSINKLAIMLIAEEFYNDLVADTSGEHYFIREIYNKVHSDSISGAKTVNVTADIEGEIFTFNIVRNAFYYDNHISVHLINPAPIREKISKQLKKKRERLNDWKTDKIHLSDILEISYKKKVLYTKDMKDKSDKNDKNDKNDENDKKDKNYKKEG